MIDENETSAAFTTALSEQEDIVLMGGSNKKELAITLAQLTVENQVGEEIRDIRDIRRWAERHYLGYSSPIPDHLQSQFRPLRRHYYNEDAETLGDLILPRKQRLAEARLFSDYLQRYQRALLTEIDQLL